MEKSAGVVLEFKDLDSSKGTGVIMHSVYNSIDLAKDISTQGMFDKSWNESKAAKGGLIKNVRLLFNHNPKDKIGIVTNLWDDEKGAYTEFKFGGWQRGQDVKEMADAGVLEGASYGYKALQKEMLQVKGQKVRKLKEVYHGETSLLDVDPCHPEAQLISMTKAFDGIADELKMLSAGELDILKAVLSNDMANIISLITLAGSLDTNSDLYGGIMYMISRRADFTSNIMDQLRWNARQIKDMQATAALMDGYLTKAKASDETIIELTSKNNELKQFISAYDTAFTHIANESDASEDEVKAMLARINIALTV